MNQADELLDVVDANDSVVQTLTRGEIHRRDLKHRSIHLLVFNDAGGVFLQKRSMRKDNNPGLWDSSVSGHVDSGEDYDDCVIREAEEEIGLKLTAVPERLFKLQASADTGYEFTWIYRCFANGPFELNAFEIDYGDWFSAAEIDQWLIDRPTEVARSAQLIWRTYKAWSV
jgi:isopentenyl-diphosphate Delta-isomerase